MTVVNTHEAKTKLSRLLEEVQQGKEVVIARANRPVARLVPFQKQRQARQPGYLKGKIQVAADFDAPLPPEVIGAFEEGG
jgi:prevent-host-death family protein